MNPLIALLAAAVGYLFGSISFARLVVRLVAPQLDITGIELDIPDAKETLRVEAMAGTAVATRLGDRYGCLTSLLDMLKITVPTLAFKLGYPGMPYFLIAAAMGLVGHNWPLYHRFRGGRGLSAIYGGFLVIDPIGTLVTSLAGLFLGLVLLRDVLVSYTSGMWLMIPWLWFRTHDPAQLAYVILVNVIFVVAMIPDIKVMRDRRRRGVQGSYTQAMEATPMGRGITKIAGWFGLRRKSSE